MSDRRRSLSEFFDRLFSSMCFGGVFGCWLLLTVIILLRRGVYPALQSAALYLAAWLIVMLLGWLVHQR